jgi:hypothetical protein
MTDISEIDRNGAYLAAVKASERLRSEAYAAADAL